MTRLGLDALLHRFVKIGRLTVLWPDQTSTSYGTETGAGPVAAVHLRDRATVRRLSRNPELALGEAYMDGAAVPVDCSIEQVLDLLMANLSTEQGSRLVAALNRGFPRLKRWIGGFIPPSRARRNAAHHYDLDGRLYALFLDRDRQYSCAYFQTGRETLEEAQSAKKRLIATKLCLDRPDLSVLDIGSGWGGLALTLARDHGARVTGITLSTEQLAEARARATAAGLDGRVSFELLDYRTIDRRFDRIVSVGMFEHVGTRHYQAFFDTVKRCLAPEGVALLHTIGRPTVPLATNRWIGKYIFPGGHCPSLSEITPAIEKARLLVTDIEVLRLHYAETLRHWRRRFAANRDTIAALTDERFCRMWEFYLTGSELSFRWHRMVVFQIQIAGPRSGVPLTRDYLAPRTARAAEVCPV